MTHIASCVLSVWGRGPKNRALVANNMQHPFHLQTICILFLLLPSCYAHVGQPRGDGFQELFEQARAACERQDEVASRHLLKRWVRQTQGLPQEKQTRERARTFLEKDTPCVEFYTP